MFEGGKLIWFNGEMVPWDDARVHVLSHALHYGSSVFEGIRVYKTPDGPKVFRLTDHMQRLYDSAKIYRMPIPYMLEELHAACCETVRDSGLSSAYIRPIALRGDCGLGATPFLFKMLIPIPLKPIQQHILQCGRIVQITMRLADEIRIERFWTLRGEVIIEVFGIL